MNTDMDTTSVSLSKPAFTAGLSLTVMTILAIFVFPALQPEPIYIAGVAAIIFLDVVIALALFRLLRSVGSITALLMTLFRLVYAAVFTYALFNIADITAFYAIWDSSFVLFGIHLVILGYLVYRSGYIPKWLGILVVIAGVGYLIDSAAAMLGHDTQVSIFTFFGEVLLGVWLMVKSRTLARDKALVS